MLNTKSLLSLIGCTTLSFALVSCGSSSTKVEESKSQSVTDGAPCKAADEVITISGTTYTCVLTGEKTLTWSSSKSSAAPQESSNSSTAFGIASSRDISAVIQNWGFALAPYDPTTGMAGVMKIKGVKAPPFDANNSQYSNYLFVDYGDPNNGHTDVQPQFFLPLGTPVLSMVDGVVCDVPLLYSMDYSVRVAPTGTKCEHEGRAQILFETEHVMNPVVKFGDSVKAGQQLATVSDYHTDWKVLGFGVVEIGVFFAKLGSPDPWHACPMRFFAPNKRDSLLSELASIQRAWEAETGDSNLYDESSEAPTGCTTLDDFNDNNSAAG